MDPSELLGSRTGRISDDKQERFNLKCCREFARAVFGIGGRDLKEALPDDTLDPWGRLEEVTSVAFPWFVFGQRVPRFNLMDLVLDRLLKRNDLLTTFAELLEQSDGRDMVMPFKYNGDGTHAGTTLVITDDQSVKGVSHGLRMILVNGRPEFDDTSIAVLPFKSWLEYAKDHVRPD